MEESKKKKEAPKATVESNVQQNTVIPDESVTDTAAEEAVTELPPEGQRFIDQVVDYDTDIKPYHVTLLVAGVGAGKTTFLGKLAKRGLNVLEITSRRAVADEQREELNALAIISTIKASIGSNKICVLTNAQIEIFYKNGYDEKDPDTYIWNYFDVIALDECHSLVTDATFADSGFFVQNFLKIAIRKGTNCHFMFMTGTPEPIEYLFDKKNDELVDQRLSTYHKLDRFQECRHVMPKRVMPVEQSSAYIILKELLANGDRVIYFSRTITNIVKIIEALVADKFDRKLIGVDFSDDERKNEFSEEDIERRMHIRDSLRIDKKLPDDIQLFLSTTKNKEGININNKDIHYMFAESNLHSELRQMSGRLRNFTDYECFFIVYDQYWKYDMAKGMFHIEAERSIMDDGLDAYNRYKNYAATYTNASSVHTFMSPLLNPRTIEKELWMVRYLPHDFKPQWFKNREESFRLSIRNSYELHDYIDHWNDPGWGMIKDVDDTGKELDTEHLVNLHNPDYFIGLDKYKSASKLHLWWSDRDQPKDIIEMEKAELAVLEKKATRKLTGKECLGLWFPGASIEKGLVTPKTPEEVLRVFAVEFVKILDKLGIEFGVRYDVSKFNELTVELNGLLKKIDYKKLGITTFPVKKLNPALKKIALEVKRPNNKTDKRILIQKTITLPEDTGGYVEYVEDDTEYGKSGDDDAVNTEE